MGVSHAIQTRAWNQTQEALELSLDLFDFFERSILRIHFATNLFLKSYILIDIIIIIIVT